MKLEQASCYFSECWTSRTGDKSEFSHSQSPFVRKGLLCMRELPGQMVDLLLGSIRCKTDTNADRAEQEQPRKASKPVLWPAALISPAYGIVASFLPIPSVANALVLAVLAAASVCWILWAAKKQGQNAAAERRNPVNHHVSVWPEIDESAMNSVLETSEEAMTVLVDYLRAIEEDTKRGHDVTQDKLFGQWIQKLYMYAARHEDNRGIQVLKEELTEVLSGMGVYVYDEIILDTEGNPDLPEETYYIDQRAGETFTKVKMPVVYSRRKLLAQGILK